MGRLKDMIRMDPVHERKMDFRTQPLDGGRLIVEGSLRDELLIPGYHWDSQPRPRGVAHHMVVRLLLEGWPLTIVDAEAEMIVIPHELCPTAIESLPEITGLSITSGFSEEVRKRLGGPNGCAHMTHLIMAMGPAAVHGYWTERSRTPHPIPRSLDEYEGLSLLVNSCRLWRKGGPLLKSIEERLSKG